MVRLTDELLAERETFQALIAAALGPRARVTLDADGWPQVPGRYGRLEWRGVEAGAGPARGPRRVYAFTPSGRMIPKLLALPGVHRWQTGDQEAAVWIAAEDTLALEAVAALLQTRIRRPATAGNLAALAQVNARRKALVPEPSPEPSAEAPGPRTT
jgi:hypothetical protein